MLILYGCKIHFVYSGQCVFNRSDNIYPSAADNKSNEWESVKSDYT